ncbi:MAG: di-trans,poly-cis-decaprenylcistransferase [Candidatus Sungbacteria bacterium]|nr:di-trans,poly-cis-decaprenylcistransferase [Candidatus Sungbacteria bacterium]
MSDLKIPTHLAIIPDGNRRWAKQHGLLPWEGHQKGAEQFRTMARAVFKSGISSLTLWAASEDNLRKRHMMEIAALVKIFTQYLRDKESLENLREDHARFRVYGRGREIVQSRALDRAIMDLETATSSHTARNLTILFGYDGRQEMVDAMQKISQAHVSTIKYQDIKNHLWTRDLPPVDLVIRTAEEDTDWTHWSSGFMMWDTANAEFYFTKTFWPDFSEDELGRVLAGYQKRRQTRGT